MTPARIGIGSFAAGVAVSVATRVWAATALPHGERVFYGGLLVASLAWLVGAYYGYRAIRGGGT
jgi:hypothetical protein